MENISRMYFFVLSEKHFSNFGKVEKIENEFGFLTKSKIFYSVCLFSNQNEQ